MNLKGDISINIELNNVAKDTYTNSTKTLPRRSCTEIIHSQYKNKKNTKKECTFSLEKKMSIVTNIQN